MNLFYNSLIRYLLMFIILFIIGFKEKTFAQDEWGEPRNLGPVINTDQDEYYPSISADGKRLFFSRTVSGTDDIFLSDWTGRGWGTPKRLNSNINTRNSEISPFITAEEKKLYFVAYGRGGGYGEWDIWVSSWENGDWGPPVNLGPMINTPFTEWTVSLSADGQKMYFASDKFIGGWGDLDFWVSTWGEAGWVFPKNMGPNINSQFWEFGTSVTGDGSELYFTRANFSNIENTHDIYRALWNGSQWQVAERLPAPVNANNAKELDPSVSENGQSLYFVSDRPGGLGGQDIWMSQRQNSVWTEPVNPGGAINSAFKEQTPFITADGTKLYFVSDQDGSDDIYYSENIAGQWTMAKKLNSNINTDREPKSTNNVEVSELSPVVSVDGQELYFLRWTSERNSWQLYTSTWQDTGWGLAIKVGGNVSETWRIFVTLDKKKLYLSKHIPKGYGDEDLWVSTWQEAGQGWGPPQNLGKQINKGRVYGASISVDGKELYYSGWQGPREHAVDLYVSKKDSLGFWSKGERLNINSEPDSSRVPVKAWDHYPSLSSDGKLLYFASRREGGVFAGTDDIWVSERTFVDAVESSQNVKTPILLLQQNYPNPFNDSTIIQYYLPGDGFVSLKIYNLFGEEVITLVNEKQLRGQHSAQWFGKNAQGKEVSSGIYFCTLKTLQVREVIKLLFLK